MKIYHYTKGIHLNSIFTDGFIATEQTRNLNYSKQAPFVTDLAWFTEKTSCPITALPYISSIHSTNLNIQQNVRNLHTDFVEIGKHIGYFWRFGFDSKNSIFEKWHSSSARANALKSRLGRAIEKIASNVGDEPRKFWVSNRNVLLKNTTLEFLSPKSRSWEIAIDEFSINDKNPALQKHIVNILNLSEEYCNQLGFPITSFRKAA